MHTLPHDGDELLGLISMVNFLVFKLTWKYVGLRLAISVMLLGSPLGQLHFPTHAIQPMQCHYMNMTLLLELSHLKGGSQIEDTSV